MKKNKIFTNGIFNLYMSMVKKSDYNYISPKEFNLILFNAHDIYRVGQHDCSELLRILLEHISKENNRIKIKAPYEELVYKSNNKSDLALEYHNFFLKKENSFIVDIFYTQLENIITCACGYDSFSFQKNLDIPIYLPINNREYELISLIKDNFSSIINDWKEECFSCKKNNQKHFKKVKFAMLNEIIIFSIQRFDYINNLKNNSYIIFDEFINMKDLIDNDLEDLQFKFKLFATIHHIGSIDTGHYYVIIRKDKEWITFNDSVVEENNNMNFKSNTVCFLVYQKI